LHAQLGKMKKGIHPEDYRLVVFKDMSNDYTFLSRSCAPSKDTVKWEDGNEYPLIKLEISHKSHPFFTGKMQFVDTAGRVDKFRNRYAKQKK
jgi:large subunit ribosomal protein L31|tara:strand:+ start:566 stop:841 length:276 start_codon:yes stop_codon:yes gene_type:complete